jgi:hypothetical protein
MGEVDAMPYELAESDPGPAGSETLNLYLSAASLIG